MITATYRIQLHRDHGFRAAADLVDYLHALGISHVYASPYFTSQQGSTHGYDLVDPKALNPELGGVEGYRELTDALAKHGMGHIVDFVPNHMAASPMNRWWHDVLENGPASLHAEHFDIEWNPPKEALRGKVLLPVLGGQYGEVLERGELSLERTGGSFCLRYFDRCFPVNPSTIAPLVVRAAQNLALPSGDPRRQDLESVARGLARLVGDSAEDRAREKEVLKRRLGALAEDPLVAATLDDEVRRVNGSTGSPEGGPASRSASAYDDLDQLIVAQSYRLAYWRVAAEEINYRRFFEINDLAAIRMETEPVFADMHELLLELVKEGRVDGVRLDHVDGLYDPPAYFQKLRGALEGARTSVAEKGPVWVIVEKILSQNETLPRSWAVDGTTGYEWLATTNGLFVDPRAEDTFGRVYRELTGDTRSFGEHAHEAKRTVLRSSLASELQMLAVRLERIATKNRGSRDYTLATLRRALGETIAAFPIYRTYVRPDGTSEATDARVITRALRVARRKNPEIIPSVFAFLESTLLGRTSGANLEEDGARHDLAMRFQQLTGPVVAKGVEDTAFYTYVRFVGVNEVGGSPERFGTTVASFHALNTGHAQTSPRTMTTTSTHDTKRGEDVRARLAVLTEMPEAYAAWIAEWRDLAEGHRVTISEDEDVERIPSPKDQLLFFQTVLGAYPLAHGCDETFIQRIAEYMVKAAREAKQHTSWLSPDEVYENGLRRFVADMLADEAFCESLDAKANMIATHGASNGLAQIVLKMASPGIPDTYQGSETWDLRLVDPDNRTPVDYAGLREALRSLEGTPVAELLSSFRDGRIKLHVLTRALRLRRAMPEVFLDGDYHPVHVGDDAVAFVREHERGIVACAVTRFPLRVTGGRAPWAVGEVWNGTGTTTLALPKGRYRDALTDQTVTVGSDPVPLARLFRDLPVALLVREDAAST